jgi:hypothetical protein
MKAINQLLVYSDVGMQGPWEQFEHNTVSNRTLFLRFASEVGDANDSGADIPTTPQFCKWTDIWAGLIFIRYSTSVLFIFS